jgi:cytochrome P450
LSHLPPDRGPANNALKDGHFLLGQVANQITAASPLEPFMTWAKQWPDAPLIRYLSFGNSEAIMINDLAAYREIEFAKCYSFGKPDFFKRMIGEVVGNGMFFADGDVHKSQRKTFNGMRRTRGGVARFP